jgi:hypothetical protein
MHNVSLKMMDRYAARLLTRGLQFREIPVIRVVPKPAILVHAVNPRFLI